MAKSKRQPKRTKKPAGQVLQFHQVAGESEERAIAHLNANPTIQAAATMREFGRFSNTDLTSLVGELAAQVAAVRAGDMARPEAMLLAQAHTLDALSHSLIMRATNAEYVNNFEIFMKLALRAQSQCRSTLEALAEMKSPRNVAFVRQANIARHQQVNNATQSSSAWNDKMQEQTPLAQTTKAR